MENLQKNCNIALTRMNEMKTLNGWIAAWGEKFTLVLFFPFICFFSYTFCGLGTL